MNLPDNPHSVEEVFIKSTDDRGHNEHLTVRVPPDMARLVSVIVARRKMPYDTSSDLIRDAIWHRLADIVPVMEDHEPSTLLARLNLANQMLVAQKSNEELISTLDNLGVRLSRLGSLEEKKRLVKSIHDEMLKVKDVYWRDRATSLIKEMYGPYLE